MTAQNKATIKSYFESGDKPTQAQFADLVDSYIDTLNPTFTSAALNSPTIIGGTISSAAIAGYVPTSASVTGTGLITGGGPFTGNLVLVVSAATQTNMEAGTSNTSAVTPAVQQFHPSAAKAWCTISYSAGGVPSLLSSYNVTSLIDNGVGDVIINFTVPFSSTNFITLTGYDDQSIRNILSNANSVSSGRIRTLDNVNNPIDLAVGAILKFIAFGDQ